MRIASYVPAAALILAACSSDPESRLLTPTTPSGRAAAGTWKYRDNVSGLTATLTAN
jgi:hypothetical protein